jgi:phosphatidylglycerophosphate synthase
MERGSQPCSMRTERKTIMTMFFIFLILLIALALVANRWGFDSRDGIDSAEWEKRMNRSSSPHH